MLIISCIFHVTDITEYTLIFSLVLTMLLAGRYVTWAPRSAHIWTPAVTDAIISAFYSLQAFNRELLT